MIFTECNLQDNMKQDVSSGSSCDEELDSPDEYLLPNSPSHQLRESGIVIEFESHSPSTVPLVSQPTRKSRSVDTSEQFDTYMDDNCPIPLLQQSDVKEVTEFQREVSRNPAMATRSLSAVKRKQTTVPSEVLGSTQGIIDAISAENNNLPRADNLSQRPEDNSCKIQEKSPFIYQDHQMQVDFFCAEKNTCSSQNTDKDSNILESARNFITEKEIFSKAESPIIDPSDSKADQDGYDLHVNSRTCSKKAVASKVESPITNSPTYCSQEATISLNRLQTDKLPKAFKPGPVLVNRYKAIRGSQSPGKGTHAGVQKSSDDLTEHTISLITAKVRKMDARYILYYCVILFAVLHMVCSFSNF